MSIIRFVLLSLLLASATTFAQDQDVVDPGMYHPALTDKWMIGIGGYWPEKDITIKVNATLPGIDSFEDVEEDISYRESDSSAALLFRWRFGEKWSFWAQYWGMDGELGYTLEEDIVWEDITFKEGSFVNTGTELTVARLFMGRTFSKGPKHEFGLGVGAHWMEFGAFIEGDIQTDIGGTDFQRGDVKAEFPMPNLGGWYYYSWHSDWMLQARLDWLRVDIGDYSGGLINALVGVDWRPFEHVGFGLALNSFILDADVDKESWGGSIEYSTYGPLATMNFTW